MNLELDDNKDSDEYKKNLDYLTIALDIEKKLYETIDNRTMIELVTLLLNDKLSSNFCGNVDSIINENYNNKIIRRVLNKLNEGIDYNNDTYFNVDDQVENFNENIFMPIPDLPKENNSISPSILVAEFESIIYQCILDIIIEQEKHDINDFIKSKYNMTFINNFLETLLVNNNFNIPENETYINNNEKEYTFDIVEHINEKKKNYYTDIAYNYLLELNNFSDDDYRDKIKYNKTVILLNLINYIMQELDENEINDLKLKYKYNIKYKDDNNISKDCINALFKRDK